MRKVTSKFRQAIETQSLLKDGLVSRGLWVDSQELLPLLTLLKLVHEATGNVGGTQPSVLIANLLKGQQRSKEEVLVDPVEFRESVTSYARSVLNHLRQIEDMSSMTITLDGCLNSLDVLKRRESDEMTC